MAGDPPDAAHRLDTVAQMGPVQAAFLHMAAVKGDKIQIGAGKIQAQRGGPAQPNRLITAVYDSDRSRNQVIGLKYTVKQLYPDMGGRVLHRDNQRVRIFVGAKEGGQALQCVLPALQLCVYITQIRHIAAVGQLQLQRG